MDGLERQFWLRDGVRIARCRYPRGYTMHRESCPHLQLWSVHHGHWTTTEADRWVKQPTRSVSVHLPKQPCQRVIESPLAALSVEFTNGQTLTETPLPIPLWKVALELREQQPDWLAIDEYLAEVATVEDPGSHCGSATWLSEAKDILEDQFRKPPTLAELAYTVGISPNHLCAQFRNRYGKTISGYVRELRVTVALQAAGTPNAWVAGGFYDASHFRRDARRVLGTSPSDLMRLFAEP